MMRVVIDTNVFVSAALKDKSLPAIAVHLATQRGILLRTAATQRQLFEVIDRPYLANLIAPATRDWLEVLMAKAEAVTISEAITACRDPTDDKFLELAVNGYAAFFGGANPRR
jgi:putative PIN family toxin of toxin-antitoxin system